MKCNNPKVTPPVDFEGHRLNVKIDASGGKVWVCIDEESVFRAQRLSKVTIEDERGQFVKESLASILARQSEQGDSLLTVLQGAITRLEGLNEIVPYHEDNSTVAQMLDDNKAFIEELAVAGLCRVLILKVQRPITTNDPNMKAGVCLVYSEDQSLNQFLQVGAAMEWFQEDFKMFVKARLWADGVLQLIARAGDQPW